MAIHSLAMKKLFRHEGGFVEDPDRVESLLRAALFKESGLQAGTVPTPRKARDYNCSAPNCERRAYAKGYCNAHHLRQRDGRPMDAPIAHRMHGTICTECDRPLRGKGGWGLCSKHFKARRQRVLKTVLVELFGNACSACDQSFPLAVFDFHHHDSKEDSLGYLLRGFGLKRIAGEVVKCVLLCANCHRLEHNNG